MIWRTEVLDQLDLYWDYHLAPRLQGLGDDEYLWEPVPDCWSVRTGEDGRTRLDLADPTPDPPPVTTIAWRLCHVAFHVLGIRASTHFGDGSLTLDTMEPPVTAEEGVAVLEEQYHTWRKGVLSLDDDALARPIGDAEGQWSERPMATLVLHVNREVMHHGAEIALLRDLHRAHFG